jgi:hypothetical protein
MSKIKSRNGMSMAETACWWFAVTVSCGILYPVYRARKHAADRTTVTDLR